MKLALAMLGVCLLLASCGGKFTMVGLDGAGKSAVAFVPERRYESRLTEALFTAEESVLPALRATPHKGDWKLRTAVLGFGVKAEVGIGPFKVAFKPRIRAAFANGTKPPIP